ncbi:hypothetical protein Ddc_14940 [Ditylenchus destructor]|nr:hypothetical protein Ddc_14940 [Ditylenchus destructor]
MAEGTDSSKSGREMVEIDLTQDSDDDSTECSTAESDDAEVPVEAGTTAPDPAKGEEELVTAEEDEEEQDGDDESSNSSDSVDDLIEDEEDQRAASRTEVPEAIDPDKPSTSAAKPGLTVIDANPKATRIFTYEPPSEDEDEINSSHTSVHVSDTWSELDGEEPRHESRETQEAVIQEQFKEALAALRSNNRHKACQILMEIITNPQVDEEFRVDSWEDFDWDAARQKASTRTLSNLSKVYFSANLAMVDMVENPLPFYIQALTVRPDIKPIWLECGQAAAKANDFSTAEFCFHQCHDQLQALEALLLLHFVNREFHQCVIYLNKILAQCKDHRLAQFVHQEISQNSPIWKEFLHTQPFVTRKPVGQKTFDTIKTKIEEFRRCSQTIPSSSGALFLHMFGQVKKVFEPLKLEVEQSTSMEEFGSKLCDAFDSIECFSSFAEQLVIVSEKKKKLQDITTADDNGIVLNADVTSVAPKYRFGVESSARETATDISENEEANAIKAVMDRVLEAVSEDKEYPYLCDGDAVKSADVKKRRGRPKSPIKRLQGRRLGNVTEKDTNSSSTSKSAIGEQSVLRRRSTRFVEEVDMPNCWGKSRFGPATKDKIEEESEDEDEWDLLQFMGIPQNSSERNPFANSLLSKRLSGNMTGGRRSGLSASVDSIENVGPLPTTESLIKLLSEKGPATIDKCLYAYLRWIALEQPKAMSLTCEQADRFGQLYIRWAETFFAPLRLSEGDLHFWNDMAIHMLAAELGSPRALSILQMHFATKSASADKNKDEHPEDVIPSTSRSMTTSPVKENMKGRDSVVEYKIEGDPLEAEMDLLLNLVGRIREEEKSEASSAEINATIRQLQRHSISSDEIDSARQDVEMREEDNEVENEQRREIEIRYRWLVAHLKAEEIGLPPESQLHFLHRYTNLLNIVKMLENGERIKSHANFGNGCVSLTNVCALLYEEWRRYNSKQIDQLRDNGKFDELHDVLLNHYDWTEASEETQIEQLLLLQTCAMKKNDISLAIECICSVLTKLRNRVINEKETKSALNKCLNFIATLDFNAMDQLLLHALGNAMTETVTCDHVPLSNCTQLWLLCHKFAKSQEGELTKDRLVKFYEANEDINCMPTKALTVLSKAHEVLGDAHICHENDGSFIRFMLDEFAATMSNPEVISAIDSKEMIESIGQEIYQIICCTFGDPTWKALRNRYEDHCSKVKWKADWSLAKKMLPLLLPRKLPEMYALDKMPTEMIEVISRIFKFVLWLDVKMVDAFTDFCRNPPSLELKEVTDADGLTVSYSEEYNTADGRDPRSALSESIDAALQNDEASKQCLSLSAKCLYLICLSHQRNNTWDEEVLRMLRSCLAISVPFLDDRIQSSAWLLLATHMTNNYTMLPDAELLEKTDEFLFPYKLAIYLKNDFCEAHLDIAITMYQIRTRLERFASKESTDKALVKALKRKTNGMLLKCRVHFELARKYNDATKEVPWLSAYFLAKIAEKLGDPAEKVMDLYHQSAIALEKEGYTYPQKIHRTKQTNFEPLEIYYKVHSYAHKQLSTYKAKQARTLALGSLEASATHLTKVHAFLEQFSHYGVATRTGKSDQRFYEKPQTLLSSWCSDQCAKNPENDFDLDVHSAVHQMVSVTDLHGKMAAMCSTAFETILAKFPHYKACYRLAKMYHDAGENKKCSDTIFDRLLFPTKKKTGSSSSSSIFENITEIVRNDFERSGSWAYHAYNIVHLAITACFRSKELNRLVAIELSLVCSKCGESEPDKLSQKSVDHLRNRCMIGILKMANGKLQNEKNTDSMAMTITQLQDLLRKMKRENVCEKHYPEVEEMITKYMNRRAQLLGQTTQSELIMSGRLPEKRLGAPIETAYVSPKRREPDVITLGESPPKHPEINTEALKEKMLNLFGSSFPGTTPHQKSVEAVMLAFLKQQQLDQQQQLARRQQSIVSEQTKQKSPEKVASVQVMAQRPQKMSQTQPTVKRRLADQGASPHNMPKRPPLTHSNVTSPGPSSQVQRPQNKPTTVQQHKTSSPLQKRKFIQIKRENLSKYFEEVMLKYPIERQTDITKYLNNPTTAPDKKKQLVVRILEGAGYQVLISPKKNGQPSPQKRKMPEGSSAQLPLKRAPGSNGEQSTSGAARVQEGNQQTQKENGTGDEIQIISAKTNQPSSLDFGAQIQSSSKSSGVAQVSHSVSSLIESAIAYRERNSRALWPTHSASGNSTQKSQDPRSQDAQTQKATHNAHGSGESPSGTKGSMIKLHQTNGQQSAHKAIPTKSLVRPQEGGSPSLSKVIQRQRSQQQLQAGAKSQPEAGGLSAVLGQGTSGSSSGNHQTPASSSSKPTAYVKAQPPSSSSSVSNLNPNAKAQYLQQLYQLANLLPAGVKESIMNIGEHDAQRIIAAFMAGQNAGSMTQKGMSNPAQVSENQQVSQVGPATHSVTSSGPVTSLAGTQSAQISAQSAQNLIQNPSIGQSRMKMEERTQSQTASRNKLQRISSSDIPSSSKAPTSQSSTSTALNSSPKTLASSLGYLVNQPPIQQAKTLQKELVGLQPAAASTLAAAKLETAAPAVHGSRNFGQIPPKRLTLPLSTSKGSPQPSLQSAVKEQQRRQREKAKQQTQMHSSTPAHVTTASTSSPVNPVCSNPSQTLLNIMSSANIGKNFLRFSSAIIPGLGRALSNFSRNQTGKNC